MGIKKTLAALFCASTLINSAYAAENALSFDGTDDRITVGDNAALEMGTNFSLAVWINPTAAAISSNYANIALKGQNSVAWDSWNLTLRGGKVVFAFGNGNGDPATQNRLDSTTTLTANTWAHIAVTYDNAGSDGKNLKIYINGVEDASSNPTATAGDKNSNLQIGGDATTGGGGIRNMFGGVIDELSLWNKTLSAADVTAISAETFTDNGGNVHGSVSNAQLSTLVWSDLSAYFTMNEGTGTTVGDISSSALSGSFANSTMPTWVASSTNPGAIVVIAPPTNLAVSNLTATSFTLSWDAVTDADNYTVVVAKNSDLVTDAVSLPAGGITTNTTLNITGLDKNTTYYYGVKTNDGGQSSVNSTGSTNTYDSFTTTDATNGDVVYSTIPWSLNSRFQIKGVAASGENSTTISTSNLTPVAYLDDFSSTQSITLNKNNSYDFDITLRDNSNNNGWIDGQVWVDWNRDGDFNDAGEALGLIGNGTSKGQREVTITKSVAVPAGASTGNTRMRIRVADSGGNLDSTMSPDSNTPVNYGTAQDYTIAVQAAPVTTEIAGYDAISDVDAGPTNAPTYADAAAVITYLDANVTSATITGSSPAATTAITGWADTGTYNASAPGSYTFTGTLDTANLPSGYVDAVDTITSVTVEVVVGNPTAALAIGDVIAVDLSSVGGSAPNFNVMVPSENVSAGVNRGTIASGSVVKYNDGSTVATGVSLSLENSFDATGGNDGNSDWTGTAADPYYVDAAEDIVYNNPTNPISLTFSGLDQSLKYNVRVYALYDDGGANATDTYSVTNGAGTETSVMARADRMAATTLDAAGGVFNFLEADINGEITASVQMTSGSGWTSFAAVVLEVVDPVTPAIGLELSLTDNVLAWKVEEERDVKEYRIIVDGKLFDTVKAVGADFYSLVIPTEAKDVVLEVVDNSGHVKPYAPVDGNIVTEIYELKEGWNLIAITSDDADLETLKGETVGVLWGWGSTSYEVVDTAKATDAVWVYAPTAKQVHIVGTKSDATISLNIGWNMVGPVVTSDVPEGADTVYSWDSVYDIITEKYNALEQGKGYWIFSL